ncbi:tRNA (adenosine(37)-N6)-dimethylallyltransferase MiaA [Clostridium sp. E02]|uniref:tRNA (adenosine(37)-N6)-dimethylallyltransferase MiaA n=1 Tax=Clostridium sp. E02 TaxID=2487134 RepID=UPI000F522CBA|nr:tRNA (adenosine(37)-N6)-dimethylallyltransferase MiaA [Clostridium sp. E02]
MMKPLIILTGPTAVGKTDLSIRLAKAIGGEIISADSMQVYRHMDIGSAKITKEEMDGIPHHLIDVLNPGEEFNVTVFQKMAREAVETIYSNGNIPIVTGGTGFYIQALIFDIDFTDQGEDTSIRKELECLFDEKGSQYLHDILEKIDPVSAKEIHQNNRKRVIRAIEYFRQTGEKISEHNKRERQKESPYDFLYYVIQTDRDFLYQRINKRVDQMLLQGLVSEVEELKAMGCTKDMVSMQGIGYKEILSYLNGTCSLEEAVEQLKQNTRHFAKRQITWFKREREVRNLYLPDYDNSQDKVLQRILLDINDLYGMEKKKWK